jgi:anti-sigma regulatory factor (Ser/Thr protein kinase)
MSSLPAAPPAPIHTPLRPCTLSLGVIPESVGRARRFARQVCAGYPADLDVVELAASELVTNAIRAAARLASDNGHPWRCEDRPVCVGMCPAGRWALLSVRDPGASGPVRRVASETDEDGRGLMIIEALARLTWTVHHRYFKVVHALLPAPGVLVGDDEVVAVRAAAEHLVLT